MLDPAHGGTDSGARGEGTIEKDIVLSIARTVRVELERLGYRVVMTRNDDSNPSYDDRGAVANAYRDAIFISIHASSTGTPGTARAYYNQFGAQVPSPAATTGANGNNPNPQTGGLIVWDEAQRPYVEASHHLADLMQSELAQLFSGSPATSAGAAVRGLRSITAPAVAVEISSVSAATPDSLTAAAAPLSTAIEKSILAFRQASSGGAK